MKVRNLNSSSVKTRRLIKDTFVKMLTDKSEIDKITVSALVERAEISRATFYSHFDDIYSVIEEYENELINEHFTNAKLLATDSYEVFFDELFAFMKKNYENYKMMQETDHLLFSARKLSELIINKYSELCAADANITDREFIELDITVFVNGLMLEYIKCCSGASAVTASELYAYIKSRHEKFIKAHCRKPI